MPRTKEARARIKAVGPDDGLAEGEFIALVSVFDNEDSMGDVVRYGAFGQVLAEWKASGDPLPVIWSHNWSDPFAHIGVVIESEEIPDGLKVRSRIEDLDTNPTARHVHGLIKGRRIKQFSFAYDIAEGGWVDTDDLVKHPSGFYYEIKRFKALYEVGPCLVGANQETALLAAKAGDIARGVKEGRVLSQAHYDRLATAHTAIGEVLAAAEPQKASRPPAPAAGRTTPDETGHRPAAPTATAPGAPAKSSGLSPAQVLARATIRKHRP
ncbi:HK97 family phage prohead protease [Streptomyces uncialis]|uniref:HK97 family phage prohead protease n=1 Tax=Streptomyces uncialis TaxID=1048205 RepID=UPI0022503FC1|nr:HK97 family phage prohead protease [Streptomyces uncialis]MCX4661493.1 HK97 family phage prohead protease [Streptomyces uncialis]